MSLVNTTPSVNTNNKVYVCARPHKKDNVCGTGTTWFGFGDVQKVDKKFAPKFLAHPDVWMEESRFELRKTQSAQSAVLGLEAAKYKHVFNDDGTITLIPIVEENNSKANSNVPQSGGLSEFDPETANAFLNSDLDPSDLGGNGSTEGASAPSPKDVQVDPANNTGSANAADTENVEAAMLVKIKAAILALEPGNTAHFSSTNGVPIVAAVKEAANDNAITAKQVRAAWEELNKPVV